MQIQQWTPRQLLEPNATTVLVVLNQNIKSNQITLLRNLWPTSCLRVGVDGGANRIFDLLGSSVQPDIICGDFDSIRPSVLDFYVSAGTKKVHTPDQDETDFTKALMLCREEASKRRLVISDVLVFCSLDGRADQVFGNVNTLFKTKIFWPNVRVTMHLGDSLNWLLDRGQHHISGLDDLVGETCGLIPIGSPAQNVTTTGLKWNLNSGELRFGGMVSTSNAFDGSGNITVSTDSPLLWIMSLKES